VANHFITVRLKQVRAADIDFLIAGIQIPGRQQRELPKFRSEPPRNCCVGMCREVAAQRDRRRSLAVGHEQIPGIRRRRNGRWPFNGLKLPIGMPGNAGVERGRERAARQRLRHVGVLVGVRAGDTEPAAVASSVISTPCALYDCEFTYRRIRPPPRRQARYPNCDVSRARLTNSVEVEGTRCRNRRRARAHARPTDLFEPDVEMPAALVADRSDAAPAASALPAGVFNRSE